VSDREYAPRTERTLIVATSVNGIRTEEYCGPAGAGDTYEFGEIVFGTTRDLTAPEQTTFDLALTAHDHTVLSAEQVRQDQDAADLDTLVATERQQFIDAVQSLTTIVDAWDGLTNTQRQEATKIGLTNARDALRIVGKVLRFVLRRERGAAI
jgi:hypothetical protein